MLYKYVKTKIRMREPQNTNNNKIWGKISSILFTGDYQKNAK